MNLDHLLKKLPLGAVAIAAFMIAEPARAELSTTDSIYSTFKFKAEPPLSEQEAAQGKESDVATTASIAPPEGPLRPLSRRAQILAAEEARAESLRPIIERYADELGVPFELADAVVRIESRYNPHARNGTNLGLMQIKKLTAKSMGYGGTAEGLFNPETNIRYGMKYLAEAYRLANGDTCGTVMRYQGGLRAQTMSQAARTYCAKVKIILAQAN
jgi:soluble lytic murein transglycosylase-like protein